MMVQLVADSSSALTAGVAAGVAADDWLEAAAAELETFVLRKEGTGAPGGTPAVSGSPEPALHMNDWLFELALGLQCDDYG